MSNIIRFGVSLEKDLIVDFDRYLKDNSYTSRSEGLRDLIREELVKREWHVGKEIAGAISLVYNHHKRELINKLTDLQHDFHENIISSQHIHLDDDNCLEVVVVKGKPKEVERLYRHLRAVKGVKHGTLTMTTTGKKLS